MSRRPILASAQSSSLVALAVVLLCALLATQLELRIPYLWISSADAQTAASPAAKPVPAAVNNTLISYTMLVPGVLVHGLGHLAAGKKNTAIALMQWQLGGLGGATISGLYLGLSGASRFGTEAAIPALIAGSGLFLTTWIADVYGTISRGSVRQGTPLPSKRIALGYSYLRSLHRSESQFVVVDANISHKHWTFGLSLQQAMTTTNRRVTAPVTLDLLRNESAERVFLRAALSQYRHRVGEFNITTVQASTGFHIHLDRIGASLAGSFVTFHTGLGYQSVRYPSVPGADGHAVLLVGFGYGFYLPKNGELEGYYQHRRDTDAGGISPGRGQGSGFLGSFGVRLRQPINHRFSLLANTQFGASWLGTLQLEMRGR